MKLSLRFILLLSMLSNYERAFDAYDTHEMREYSNALSLADFQRQSFRA